MGSLKYLQELVEIFRNLNGSFIIFGNLVDLLGISRNCWTLIFRTILKHYKFLGILRLSSSIFWNPTIFFDIGESLWKTSKFHEICKNFGNLLLSIRILKCHLEYHGICQNPWEILESSRILQNLQDLSKYYGTCQNLSNTFGIIPSKSFEIFQNLSK